MDDRYYRVVYPEKLKSNIHSTKRSEIKPLSGVHAEYGLYS